MLFDKLGWLQHVLSHPLFALGFDLSIFFLICLNFKSPKNKYYPVLFTFFFFVYEILHYSNVGFHKHNLTGVLLLSILFWFKDEKAQNQIHSYLRLYILFIYFTSGFWKYYRGCYTVDLYFEQILKSDSLAYLIQFPDSFKSKIIHYLLAHHRTLNYLGKLSILFELLFAIGIFTKKLDKLLFVFILVFHLFCLFFLRAYFIDFSLMAFVLLINIREPIFQFSFNKLSLIVILFCLIQTYFSFQQKKVIYYNDHQMKPPTAIAEKAFPFIHFTMYSYPYSQIDHILYYRILANQSEILYTSYYVPLEEMIIHPLSEFLSARIFYNKNKFNLNYKRYLEKVLSTKISTLTIEQIHYNFQTDKPTITQCDTLILY